MKKSFMALKRTYQYLEDHKTDTSIGADVRQKWATEILRNLDVSIHKKGVVGESHPMIFVANHISYLDIPLLMSVLPDCVFVSKAEIASWPLFGSAARKIGTVFLQRSSSQSRAAARLEIERQTMVEKKRIVIFPAGTTSLTNEPPWRKGVFEISYRNQIPIQPIRLNYSPLRRVGYIENDFFPLHFLRLTGKGPIRASVELHEPFVVNNLREEVDYCQRWCTSNPPGSEKYFADQPYSFGEA